MSTPPAPDLNHPRRAASEQPLSQPNTQRRKTETEDESLGETLLDEADDAFDLSGKVVGCVWWMSRLPFRIVWKLVDAITDLF